MLSKKASNMVTNMVKRQYETIITKIVQNKGQDTDVVHFLGKKNLSVWKEFKNKGDVPYQPDIDMLLCKNVNGQRYAPLHAIEFKAFYYYPESGRLIYSYYAGIDEALALLNFGIDYVSLFHSFIFEVYDYPLNRERWDQQSDNYWKYTEPVRHLIKKLKLPIGYTAAFTFTERGILQDTEELPIIANIAEPDRIVIEAKKNPIRGNAKKIRKVIINKLKINDDKSMIRGPLIR